MAVAYCVDTDLSKKFFASQQVLLFTKFRSSNPTFCLMLSCSVYYESYRLSREKLLVVQALSGIRDKVQIATKFGLVTYPDGSRGIRGDPEHVRASCEASLKRLGIDCIDLYYQHRVDTKTPIEVTVSVSYLVLCCMRGNVLLDAEATVEEQEEVGYKEVWVVKRILFFVR